MDPQPTTNGTQSRGEGLCQDVKVLVWNVRGAGNKYFMREFREHTRVHRPSLVDLSEPTSAGRQRKRCVGKVAMIAGFPEGSVQHLLQNYSGHLPLLLSLKGFAQIATIPKPFRFQVAWTTHEDLGAVLQDNWPADTKLVPALRSLSGTLDTWNKNVFGNPFCRK
ncbi:hypothetical protein Cgig2_010834 [Carnegiea gigantea]|uniref:Uncharacterized protein n=1 Tax=Carnegiea gigantea TaxID=171969 RepID=A0A9Q1JT19_9CARY|nr:hypothetical protein Cgig2_010834 [Carnegiea gigantea]